MGRGEPYITRWSRFAGRGHPGGASWRDAWGLPARHVGRAAAEVARREVVSARARERERDSTPPSSTPPHLSGLVTPTAQPALIGPRATATRPAHAASRPACSRPGSADRHGPPFGGHRAVVTPYGCRSSPRANDNECAGKGSDWSMVLCRLIMYADHAVAYRPRRPGMSMAGAVHVHAVRARVRAYTCPELAPDHAGRRRRTE
jgi:hypothetical protein